MKKLNLKTYYFPGSVYDADQVEKVQLPPDPHQERNPNFLQDVPPLPAVPRREQKRQLQKEVPQQPTVPRQVRDPDQRFANVGSP